jgi:hypothetical protein
MSCPTVSTSWIEIAAAAREETDPKRFMILLKCLYEVLNTREEDRDHEFDPQLECAA